MAVKKKVAQDNAWLPPVSLMALNGQGKPGMTKTAGPGEKQPCCWNALCS
jgi:hypothetical protein